MKLSLLYEGMAEGYFKYLQAPLGKLTTDPNAAYKHLLTGMLSDETFILENSAWWNTFVPMCRIDQRLVAYVLKEIGEPIKKKFDAELKKLENYWNNIWDHVRSQYGHNYGWHGGYGPGYGHGYGRYGGGRRGHGRSGYGGRGHGPYGPYGPHGYNGFWYEDLQRETLDLDRVGELVGAMGRKLGKGIKDKLGGMLSKIQYVKRRGGRAVQEYGFGIQKRALIMDYNTLFFERFIQRLTEVAAKTP